MAEKKKKEKLIYNRIVFDSKEEIQFYWWCEEAKKHGIIEGFVYHPTTYTLSDAVKYDTFKQLKTKTKIIKKYLFHSHEYSPDFWISGAQKGIFEHYLNHYTIIDVKGKFQQYSDNKSFQINRKWMYQKHNIYIEKVEIPKFFLKNWLPEKARFTTTGQISKPTVGYPLINDFLKGLNK